MDTFEFLKSNFELYTQNEYLKYELSPNTKRILCEIGLPEEPIDYIQLDIRSINNLSLKQEYVVIGNDYGTDICINSKDEVISVDPQNKLPTRFINRDLKSFLDFIVIYIVFRDKISNANDEKEALRLLDEIRKEFEKIDNKAVSYEENWWAVILEQMEQGLM